MAYETRKKKISQFTKGSTLTDPVQYSTVQDGINKTFTQAQLIADFADVYGASLRTYEFQSQMVGDDIALGEYAIVEENRYTLYKITNAVATLPNIALNSGATAERVEILDKANPSTYDLLRDENPDLYAVGDVIYVSGDGIAGDFKVTTGSATDNGGTIITNATWNAAGKHLARIYSKSIFVGWFGVKADGSTDDYAAGQAAIDYAETLYSEWTTAADAIYKGLSEDYIFPGLEWPTGVIVLSQTLRLKAPIPFFGQGYISTKFQKAATFTGAHLIEIKGPPGTVQAHWVNESIIRDFTCDGLDKSINGIYGIYLHNWNITRVGFANCDYPFDLQGSYSGAMYDVKVYMCTHGGRLKGLFAPTTQENNDVNIYRINILGVDNPMSCAGGLDVHFFGGLVQWCDEGAMRFENMGIIDINGMYLEECLENYSQYDLTKSFITVVKGTTDSNLFKMTGCNCVGNYSYVNLDGARQADIQANRWHNSTTCVDIPSTSALESLVYRNNAVKNASGTNTRQEFFGKIIRNNKSGFRVGELYASDFWTGNSDSTGDANYSHSFMGQVGASKPATLIMDVMVPFTLRMTSSNKCNIIGRGKDTGFNSASQHYVIDTAGEILRDFTLKSSNTSTGSVGDSSAAAVIGGTFNTAAGMTIDGVTFESTGGVYAVEFGRNLKASKIAARVVTSAANKYYSQSEKCTYIGVLSDDYSGNSVNSGHAVDNAYINCLPLTVDNGTGNREL